MAKKLTAAQRTLIHPAIDTRETPQPDPYVGAGPTVERHVCSVYPACIHYRETFSGYGTCAACRVEASKMRAVVR